MSAIRWTWVCLLFLTSLTRAQDGAQHPLTSAEIRTELFGLKSLGESPASFAVQESETSVGEKKSTGLAALYSLVLPGMGEVYTGSFSSSGKYFLLAEGILWLTYAAFEVYGNSLRDDARTFSAAYAGVNLAGKNDQFFVDVGNFNSVDEYNQKKLQDRQPEKLYDPAAGYGWQWDSDASRKTFDARRVSAEQMYNNQKFVVATVIVNHIASAINAGRAAVVHNSAIDAALRDVEFGARVLGGVENPHGVMLTVQKGF
jgi:hypothetical protein